MGRKQWTNTNVNWNEISIQYSVPMDLFIYSYHVLRIRAIIEQSAI